MPSDSGSAWSPPASTERRLSNSSDGSAGSGYSKATTDSADFLATRPHTAAVLPGKPAANPLQFVRVGPADLGSRAREQLRRAELAKRTEPARIERQEDWQSNLDNWKSSRRKRVEHIIERCVEVRRMEHETGQPRAKSKTFNEMLEERAGRRRRNHLALYTDDDGHDLSDLGIGTSSTKSSLSEDCDTHSLASDGIDLDKNHSDVDNLSSCDNNRKLGSSANEYDTCTTTTISSPEPEEYTYEGAIEGYKSRIISQTNSNIVKTLVTGKDKSPEKNGDVNRIRTTVSNKIEEKVSSFQQERANDAKLVKKDLPKVDIHKRREQFERENSQELANKPKLPDIANKKSIKERLSSLEKFTEETHVQKVISDATKLPSEVKPLKERLSSLEKVKSNEPEKIKRLSNGDLSNTRSLKERLNSLKSQTSEEDGKIVKTEVKDVSMSLKERLSCLDAAKNKEIPKISVEEEIARNEKIDKMDDSKDKLTDSSLKSSLSGIESQMQSFCRSLDSLDINGQTSPNSFERVQSLEDFDCAEMQNNTVPSDIETEDSGIHTARDSCAPADDIADLTQVASPIGESMIEASEYESSNEDCVTVEQHKMEEEKIPEPIQTIIQDVIVEEVEEQDSKADDDSVSHYAQAVSQPEESSAAEEITEIHTDKDDEDTLKSLDNQDTSVLDALELAFKELDSEDSATMEDQNDKDNDFNIHKKISVTPLYENIDIFYQNTVDDEAFPLDMPANVLEPPKEKPPPPPTDDGQDDELLGNGNFRHTSSARRIKKEIRNKRTSFLGIEGQVDDSYLDVALTLAPRPDITSFLQEETKIEKLLYKKTLSHDDAKLRESRDSGVDVDRGPSAEAWYKGQSSPETSNPHSRQNSEPYTHVTVTSDEEESSKNKFASNLNNKLSELAPTDKIETLDKKLQQQQEVLRFERELLQLEQEELRRQRENLLRDQNRIIQKSVQDVSMPEKPINRPKFAQNYRHSMPNLLLSETYSPVSPVVHERVVDDKRKPFVSEEHIQRHFGVEESRRVLYDERKVEARRMAARVQPVPPPKARNRESIEREITMRSSRVPSAVEYVNVERAPAQLRPKPPPPPQPSANGTYHPMTRHTLQALSAAPTNKLISSSEWMQPRTARLQRPANYNYNQHWLIQEAEQRRLEEQRGKLRAAQRHSYHDAAPAHNNLLAGTLSTSQQQLSPEVKRSVQEARDDKLLSVSGRRKCSHCGKELGRGAAMIIESLSLCYHVWCFTCAVCGARLGDGSAGADVRVRNQRLHCRHCHSADDGRKYSRV
ncbi:LIM domain only protein 7 isoform X3 [Manduca sexta]|uniref:LIM domain only protein 7 isoform X3 n=1 Tax=Manduca sexta TaxID=7130 RepID=UPI0018907C32|nr:LIM domain only protein 7 isoform X3 [Manduca sexta]